MFAFETCGSLFDDGRLEHTNEYMYLSKTVSTLQAWRRAPITGSGLFHTTDG